MSNAIDPFVEQTVLDAERRVQRLTAYLRFAIIGVFIAIIPFAPDIIRGTYFPIIAESIFFLIALLSLILSRPRWFRPYWAPVFGVLDVCWFYSVMLAGALIFGLPANAIIVLPPALLIFVLIALYGMRYSPWALLAGLATFVILDVVMLAIFVLDLWPGAPLSDDPFFGTGATLFRIICIIVTGAITALASARARKTLIDAVNATRQRERVEQMFGRFIPPAVVHDLVDKSGVLAPIERFATILFCDVAGFATISEKLEPEALMATLSDYFDAIDHAIVQQGGVVIHFQGDAVLAAFNIPLNQPDHADRAIQCGKAILALTQNQTFRGIKLPTRVGIATGLVVAGSVGSDTRLGYTVYGDTVNQAARLQELGKNYHRVLLVGETTIDHCVEPPDLEAVGKEILRGRSSELTVYAPREAGHITS